MYVSIRRYEIDPASGDEILRRVEEGFVPIISNAPGFTAYYGTVTDGIACSVSVFEDQAGAEESNRMAADWVKTVAHLFPNRPQTTAGEVGVYKAAKP